MCKVEIVHFHNHATPNLGHRGCIDPCACSCRYTCIWSPMAGEPCTSHRSGFCLHWSGRKWSIPTTTWTVYFIWRELVSHKSKMQCSAWLLILPDSCMTALTSLDSGPESVLNRHWGNLTCGVMDMLYSLPNCRLVKVNSFSLPGTMEIPGKEEVKAPETYSSRNCVRDTSLGNSYGCVGKQITEQGSNKN